MNKRLIISSLLLLNASSLWAQLPPTGYASPQTELTKLLKMGDDGELLNPQGWNQAARFFVHARQLPSDTAITVIGDDYSIHAIWSRGNQAEFVMTYRNLGKIDSLLQYSPPDTRYPRVIKRYHLILTNKKWESAPSRKDAKGGLGSREWKIESPQGAPWVGLQAAIRYVTESSRKATDPIVTRNASFTLMELKKNEPKVYNHTGNN